MHDPLTPAVLSQIAEQHGRMVEVAIMDGQKAKAHAAVDRAFEAIAQADIDRITPSSNLSAILKTRITTVLASRGISTVGQLCRRTREDLLQLDMIHHKSIDLIERQLAVYGLELSRAKD